jgi:hypothetical protein
VQRELITRREAHAKGLKRYYDGSTCLRGHTGERFTSSGGCIACQTFATPNKRNGPKGNNVGWPSRGLVFNVPGILPEEVEAAFRYIEHAGWHDAAVLAIRKDPALLARFATPLTVKEQAEITIRLENDRRLRAALRGSE